MVLYENNGTDTKKADNLIKTSNTIENCGINVSIVSSYKSS